MNPSFHYPFITPDSIMRKTLLAAALLGALLSPVHASAAEVSREAVVQQYSQIVFASYEDSLLTAKALQNAINAFVAAPSEAGLNQARQAWLAAREPYGQTEAFRFYGGPIDDARGPEGQINAWPLDEAYIDGVKGKPSAGVVNNRKVVISKKLLSSLNERGGEENISTGYHAIEFLLWGQDFDSNGAGKRSYTDFVDGQGNNADRRREYLKTAAELLVDDLGYLVAAWQPNSNNFRARFEKKPDALRQMLVGIGVLSRAELAGERIEVALDSRNQEDEHSCFSDNTHRDIATNARGIQNVWLGEYTRVDGSLLKGASLRDLVAASNAKAAERVTADMAATQARAEAIKAPFDQEIVNKDGRSRVQATVAALKKQASSLVEAAKAIGIKKLNVNG
ncbi:imelysin family protein [Vogesella sp. AC12]|uniref:imelysin family protein n=1 Tax=Vogesella sp. AC12 TaxID=2950550 RepID=UPI00210BE743|nr:imelysin family protein [Vogesella sp. AC12]MCQ4143082.1 iron-regulated protein [Vogesella sp. AC12]